MSRSFLVLSLLVLLGLAPTVRAETRRAIPHAAEVTGVVNLNAATEEELRVLPGIGPTKAQRILAQRAKHKFDSTDQLMRVKGIGRKTYRKLKAYLAVTGPTTIARKKATRRDEVELDARAEAPPEPAAPVSGG